MTTLRVDGLSKRFDGVQAVRSVSFRFQAGELFGLIGPNGSGKTTTLNVITGVHRPTAGSVWLDDADITGVAPYRVARRGIGRTFQNVRLFDDLTVRENVLAAATTSSRGERGAREAVDRILHETGLADLAARRAGTLPYGSQRRLEIARALALEPIFLLLDEPAAGLNDEESDVLLETVRTLRDERGCGVLVIDHNMRLIMRLCDRIHVLDAGRTLFEGTPVDVQRSPEVIEAYLGEPRDGDA